MNIKNILLGAVGLILMVSSVFSAYVFQDHDLSLLDTLYEKIDVIIQDDIQRAELIEMKINTVKYSFEKTERIYALLHALSNYLSSELEIIRENELIEGILDTDQDADVGISDVVYIGKKDDYHIFDITLSIVNIDLSEADQILSLHHVNSDGSGGQSFEKVPLSERSDINYTVLSDGGDLKIELRGYKVFEFGVIDTTEFVVRHLLLPGTEINQGNNFYMYTF